MGAYGQGASASLGERRKTRGLKVGNVPIGGGARSVAWLPAAG